MKRRAFLKFLGLAPVAAAVPAMALPRAEKPIDIDKLTIKIGLDSEGMIKATEEISRHVDRQVILSLRNAKRRGFA